VFESGFGLPWKVGSSFISRCSKKNAGSEYTLYEVLCELSSARSAGV